MLWDNGTTDAQRGGATLHFPKVERLHSTDGGLTMATRTILLNMQPETQGQSHQISNITIGPDDKLYVHMGDGFTASTALNLNQYRGKVLRMNTGRHRARPTTRSTTPPTASTPATTSTPTATATPSAAPGGRPTTTTTSSRTATASTAWSTSPPARATAGPATTAP